MGQSDAALRFYFENASEQERRKTVASMWWLVLAVFSVGSLCLYVYGNALFGMIFPKISFYPYGAIAVGTIFFSAFGVICLATLRAQERSLAYSAVNFLGFLCNVSIVIYFVVCRKEGALGKLKADLVYSACIAIVFVIIMRRLAGMTFSFNVAKRALLYGLPLVPHQISLWSLNLVDRICLGFFKDLESVGLYSLGYNVALAVSFISSSIGMAWTPSFFKTAHEHDAKEKFARFTTYYACAVVSAAVGLTLFSHEIIRLMATPRYYQASIVIALAAWGYLFHAFYKVAARVLSYVKKTFYLGLSTALSAALNLVLNIALIPRFGMLGAAWATLIAFLFLACISFFFMQRFYPIRFETVRLLKLAASALAVCGLAFLTAALCHHSALLCALKAAYGVLFIVSLWGLKFFSAQEITFIKSLYSSIWKR